MKEAKKRSKEIILKNSPFSYTVYVSTLPVNYAREKKITTALTAESPVVIWKNQAVSRAPIHKELVVYIFKESNIILVLFLPLQLLVSQHHFPN